MRRIQSKKHEIGKYESMRSTKYHYHVLVIEDFF